MSIPLSCTKCGTPLLSGMLNAPEVAPCPQCGALIRAEAFPALVNPAPALAAEDILAESQAGCFFHPQKKAAVTCGSCGRFLCSLCDIEFGGGHVCPSCLEAGKTKRKIRNLETERVLYDSIALAIAILPLLMFFVTIVTAPVSIYYSIRYWKAPTSILPRTRVRFIAALVFSVLQLGGWGLFFFNYLK